MIRASQSQAFVLLGVKPTDDLATIRAAWRRLVRTYHPDTYQGDKAAANARLAQLNAAFDALKDYTQEDIEAARREDAAARAAAARKLEAARRRSEEARRVAEAARRQEEARRARVARLRAEAERNRALDNDTRAADLRAALREPPRSAPALSDTERKAARNARAAFAAARQIFDFRRPGRESKTATYA